VINHAALDAVSNGGLLRWNGRTSAASSYQCTPNG